MSEKMREEFEAWAASYRDHNGLPHFTLRRPDGKYVDGTTELCWRGWQASRESLEIERIAFSELIRVRDWVKNRRGQPEKLANTGQTHTMIEKYETLDMLEWAIERANIKVKP